MKRNLDLPTFVIKSVVVIHFFVVKSVVVIHFFVAFLVEGVVYCWWINDFGPSLTSPYGAMNFAPSFFASPFPLLKELTKSLGASPFACVLGVSSY